MSNICIYSCLLFVLNCFCLHSANVIHINDLQDKIINVKERGVKGDGITDDWQRIQMLIDSLANQDGGILYFPKGKYIIRNKTLLLWGKDIVIYGESKTHTIIEKQGNAGWWGELMAICGKVYGGKYYGSFGKSKYNNFLIYNGNNVPVKNILIENLSFVTNSKKISKNANNVSVFNSSNVKIRNCIFSDSPKTNLAIVNNTSKSSNINVKISDCIFQNSGSHNVRVISYNQGNILGNEVLLENSTFTNVINVDSAKELKGKKVHLWYRAGLGGKKISLIVSNCFFDETGSIVSTVNTSNIKISSCTVIDKVILSGNERYKVGDIELSNNIFHDEVFIKAKNNIILQKNVFKSKTFNGPTIK